jgi:outer membrane biosynthesis protein TonB
MRKAYVISAIGHAVVLLWGVWSFAAKPLPVPPAEAVPVSLITISELTQMTAGDKSAAKVETPKPLVEKVDEPKPVEDPAAKVVEKKEVKAAREPPPAPETKPVEAKPEKKQAETPPDPIADALAKDEAKQPEPKKADAKPPIPPKKPAPPAPKFDPNQVEALLNKRDATRVAAAGENLNDTASLGVSSGKAAQISLSELDALRQRLAQLWSIPAGASDPQELVVLVRIKLKPDGRLAAPPMVLTSGKSPLFVAARDSAIRALFRGQPYDMLKPEHYEQWKDIEITFDPRDMIRG